MQYSLKKGIGKGLISMVSVLGGILAFTGFADIEIWGLIEQYIKPIVSSLTVGGVITIVINWIKVKSKTN